MTGRRNRGAATPPFLSRLLGRGRRTARPRGRSWSNLIGRDLAPIRREAKRRSRLLLVAVAGALMAALCLAALRIDLIRQGYALAAALREEKQLLEERRLLTAQVRSLRAPARLARLASRLDFERPERVIEIDAPGVSAEPRP